MKIFLCDDNEQALEFYSEKLHELAKIHNQELDLKTFKSGRELLFHFEDVGDIADAVYLDINMPGIDGVETAERLKQAGFSGELIFLTVSENHFLPAFDVGAFNYIIKKQTTSKRFETIFLKVVELVENRKKECILVSNGGAHRKIELESIHYFEVRKRIVTVHYEDQKFQFFTSMDKLENRLVGKGFYRVNRSYLVAVESIKSTTYNSLQMENGDEVPIGRSYQKEVHKYLKGRVL